MALIRFLLRKKDAAPEPADAADGVVAGVCAPVTGDSAAPAGSMDAPAQAPPPPESPPASVALRPLERPPHPTSAPAVVLRAVGDRPPAEPAEPVKPVDRVEDVAAVAATTRPKAGQRALYYQLMDGLYDVILILDGHGHIVDANRRVMEVLGYTREQTWDMPVDRIIMGMSRQMFEHLKNSARENNYLLIDARCVRRDSSSFAGEVGVSLVSLTSHENLVFAIRNIDKRRNAMVELKRVQSAFEIALAPAFVCDTEGLFLAANKEMLQLLGAVDADQARRLRFTDILPEASRAFLRAACGENIHETIAAQLNGEGCQVEITLTPLTSGKRVTSVAGALMRR